MITYLKDLTPEEIIKRLKNGEVVHSDGFWIYKMIDGVICAFFKEQSYIGAMIDLDRESEFYFETEEPFKIEETGLYKTRDGRKVFISCISENPDNTYKASGIIQDEYLSTHWTIEGNFSTDCESDTDIISKWED